MPLWLSIATIFFYFLCWIIRNLFVSSLHYKQLKADLERKHNSRYAQEEKEARERGEAYLAEWAKKYPYADQNLFGELSLAIYHKEYEKIDEYGEKIKKSYFDALDAFEKLNPVIITKKLYTYDDIKDIEGTYKIDTRKRPL